MNPWEHLGIAQAATDKDIKRAYAKKLKVTKPDEKPEEFQQLHKAYKMALAIAARQMGQSQQASVDDIINSAVDAAATESGSEDDIEETSPQLETVLEENRLDDKDILKAEISENEKQQMQLKQQEFARLLREVDEMLQRRSSLSDPANWKFLASSAYLMDEEFNWFLGREIFKMFSIYTQKRVRRARGRYSRRELPADLVQYCDGLFSWRNNAQYFLQEFGQDFCKTLFAQLMRDHNSGGAEKGLRGGVFIREPEAVRSAPATESNEGGWGWLSEINYGGLLFILIPAVQILRYCSQQ